MAANLPPQIILNESMNLGSANFPPRLLLP
jgi:hypothetical protein